MVNHVTAVTTHNFNSFLCSSLPVAAHSLLHCGSFSIVLLEPWTWATIPLFVFPLFFTACLCSLNLTFSVLFILPTYTASHSPRELCTQLLSASPLTLISSCLRVLFGLKNGFTPSGAQTFSSFSLLM